MKQAVTLATTGNTGLSGLTTIGGVVTTPSMRVLVKNQINQANNGVYTPSTGAWTRTTDFDQTSEIVNGSYFFVNSGTTNAKTAWVMNATTPIVVGVSAITFTQFSSSSGVIAGNGICVTQSGGNYNVAVKAPANCGLCIDGSGVYINSAIAGTGLNYTTGVLSVYGSALAGNSISWTGNTFNVNTTTGTLATALSSKASVSLFNAFTGATQTLYNNTLEPTGFINNNSIN